MAYQQESSERDNALSSRGSSGYTGETSHTLGPRGNISPGSPLRRSPDSMGSHRGGGSSPASASIPIPRLPPSRPPSASAGGITSTSNSATSYKSIHSARSIQPVRSPSGSSLSSHRSHPYSRRPSYPSASPIDLSHGNDLPRIQLPAPHTSAPLGMSRMDSGMSRMESPSVRDRDRDIYDRPPPSRPGPNRTLSGESAGRGFSLPPLHTIGRDAHPSAKHNFSGHSPAFGPYPGSAPPRGAGRESPVGQPLRPSYYDAYPTPAHLSPVEYGGPPDRYNSRSQPAPQPQRHSPHHLHQPQHHQTYPPPRSQRPSVPPQRSDHRRISPHANEFTEPASPPLRSLPPEYRQPIPSVHQPHAHPGYYSNPAYSDPIARSRSQSQTARLDIEEPQNGPGQNRRIAHLMSEQKRRESINSGFNALRSALPNSIPTDSKAIVLRKAVTHITQLENLLRKAGIAVTGPNNNSGSGSVLTPASWDDDGAADLDGGEVDGDDDDVEMEADGKPVKWEDGERGGASSGRR